MNHHRVPAFAIGLLLLNMSCSEAPRQARDTRAADTKAIQDGESTWNHDWAQKDVENIMSHYADDAVLMVPGVAVMKGKDAIRTGLQGFLQDKNLSLSFTAATTDVAKSGDIGYTQGTYTLTQTDPKTKKPMTETGKYVTVYKKQADGSWKAVEDVSNADPAAPAAPEPRKANPKRVKHARRRSR